MNVSMSLNEVARRLRPPTTSYYTRTGSIAVINSDYTVDVTVGASDVTLTSVRYTSSVCPRVGAKVLVAIQGEDAYVVDTIANDGPAYLLMARPSNQSINSASDTYVDFTATPSPLTDAWGMFDTGTTDQATIKVPGLYSVAFSAHFAADSGGYRRVAIMVGSTERLTARQVSASGTVSTTMVLSGLLTLAVDDVLKVRVTHTAAGAINLLGGSVDQSKLVLVYLGPAYS